MTDLVDRASLDPASLAGLRAELPVLRTLGEVAGWLAGLDDGPRIADVVVMDEYTHDVLVSWRGGLVLVFDTT